MSKPTVHVLTASCARIQTSKNQAFLGRPCSPTCSGLQCCRKLNGSRALGHPLAKSRRNPPLPPPRTILPALLHALGEVPSYPLVRSVAI